MTITYKDIPNTGLREHLVFLALLMPTFVVIAAAAVSFVTVDDPSVAMPGADTVAICGPCGYDIGDEGP